MMCVVTVFKKNPSQIGGKVRNDLSCIDQFIRVVFPQIVLMELHFLLFSWRPIFFVSSKDQWLCLTTFSQHKMIFPLNLKKKRLYYLVVIDFCPPLSGFQLPAVNFLMLAYSFRSLCSLNFNTLHFTCFYYSGCHRNLEGPRVSPLWAALALALGRQATWV